MSKKNIYLFLIFCLCALFFFSCSDSSPKVGTVNATLVYDFSETGVMYTQHLSVFIHPTSDEKRLASIKIVSEANGYEWNIDEPERVDSGKNAYFGSWNLVCPNGEPFEDGKYIVSFKDLADREVSSMFTLKNLESMKTKNGNFVRSRDVLVGNAGSECALKRVVLYDDNDMELYCGLYNAMFENRGELKNNFPTAKKYRVYYVNKDNSCAIFMPEENL